MKCFISLTFILLFTYSQKSGTTLESSKEIKKESELETKCHYQQIGEKEFLVKNYDLEYYKRVTKDNFACIRYSNMAKKYFNLKDYSNALKYADSSLEVARKVGERERICKSYLRKSLIYKELEDYKNAYENYRNYKEYSDSISSIESIKRAQKLKLISVKQGKKVKFYILLLLGSLVVFISVGYLLYKKYSVRERNVREKLEEEELNKKLLCEKVKMSECELKTLVADNSMRLKFITKLSEQIKEDKDESESRDVRRYTQSLILRLQQQIATESKFSSIQDKVEEMDRGFDTKIVKLYPTLTKAEREICSLLRLNLSIKEIACIRNTSTDSVKAYRYRLRKKLKLPGDVELEQFMQNI